MDQTNNYDGTFEFAFNDPCFSDRVLKVVVIAGPQDEKLKAKLGDGVTKRLLDLKREVACQEENVQVLRTEQFYVNSAILASKSPFFYKLFPSGMREIDPQCEAIIKIDASENVALMELLHYMYGGKLFSATEESFITLVDVMLLSDKFQVVSCTNHCIQFLKRMPMTPKSATIYLEIASHDLVKGDIQSLANAAKEFLITRYNDVMKCQDDLCILTLPAIEVIFGREGLQVPSEDHVYDMVVKWAQEQFPDLEERRAVLGSCITRLVHFSVLSSEKLDILACDDLDSDFSNGVVKEALFFKVESSKEILNRRSIKRDYTRCIYYFDLSLDQCKRLRRGENLDSGRFYLGKQPFCLHAVHRSTESSFGLFLQPKDRLLKEITIKYTFSAMQKPEIDFMNKIKTERKFTDLSGWGKANLFDMPWESFVAKDSPYFIDEVLHLRAEATIIE